MSKTIFQTKNKNFILINYIYFDGSDVIFNFLLFICFCQKNYKYKFGHLWFWKWWCYGLRNI